MKKLIIILFLFSAIAASGVFWLNQLLSEKQNIISGEKPLVIGFSLGTTREERWFKDRDLFIKRAQELGAVVSVTLSDYDVDKQIDQIENLISQGVSVIVIVPADSEKLTAVIKKASDAGVRIIAYDRLIKDSDIDLYISFDNVKVGELEAESVMSIIDHGNFAYIGGSLTDNNSGLLKEGAMNILQPKIDDGTINLVIDRFIPDWRPVDAYRVIKDYLDSGNTLDAIVVANDGMASGVIQALSEHGLAGQVPVSGQDAELSALQRVAAGTQSSTIYKPISSSAYLAAEMAVLMAKNEPIEVNTTIDNGRKMVLTYLLSPIIVTKDNIMETVVKDGFQTYSNIYESAKK